MTFRALTAFNFKPPPTPSRDPGGRPEFRWIPVDNLVIDDRYQRPIADRGRRNIVTIIECFDWRKFKPVTVTKVEGGLFAIIDGQHRSTAVLMHPLTNEVPCFIVEATAEEAAECFAAINGVVTAMTLGQMFHARVAAGEHRAREVKAVCDDVGAKILRAKNTREGWLRGETLAVGTIERCLDAYGKQVLLTAMRAIVESSDGHPGLLNAAAIRALCIVIHGSPRLQTAGPALPDAMGSIGFRDLHNTAKAAAVTERRPVHVILAGKLAQHLGERLDPARQQRGRAGRAK